MKREYKMNVGDLVMIKMQEKLCIIIKVIARVNNKGDDWFILRPLAGSLRSVHSRERHLEKLEAA